VAAGLGRQGAAEPAGPARRGRRDGQWQDYSCTAAGQCAVLAATVPEPAGSAVLVQAVYADDYRGRTVTFRGQLRTTGVTGQAGLHLAVSGPAHGPAGAPPRSTMPAAA